MKFYRPKPHTGDTREIRKFAWYPMRINDTIYWLEWIKIHQIYNTVVHHDWYNAWVVDK